MAFRTRDLLEFAAWAAICMGIYVNSNIFGLVMAVPPLLWLRALMGRLRRKDKIGQAKLFWGLGVGVAVGLFVGVIAIAFGRHYYTFPESVQVVIALGLIGMWAGTLVGALWQARGLRIGRRKGVGPEKVPRTVLP